MNKISTPCVACDGIGVIQWPQYDWNSWLDKFLGNPPVYQGTKPDDGPCPRCDGTGIDPDFWETDKGETE